MNPLTNKFNYMPGGVYNGASAGGYGSYGNSYGGGTYGNNRPYDVNRPYDGQVNGPYPGQTGPMMPGIFGGGDFEGKSSLILPLAGAALLGNFRVTLNFCSIFTLITFDRNRSVHFGIQPWSCDGRWPLNVRQAKEAIAFRRETRATFGVSRPSEPIETKREVTLIDGCSFNQATDKIMKRY